MSRPIQTNPLGFLSLLGLKNNGNNPPEMRDDVQPVVDLRAQYLEQDARFSGAGQRLFPLGDSPATSAPGSSAGVLVGPDPTGNELWYVHGGFMAVQIPVTGGVSSIKFGALRWSTVTTSSLFQAVSDQGSIAGIAAATVAQESMVRIHGGFFLRPGEQISGWSGGAIGVLVVPAIQYWMIRYTPLRI